MGLHRILNLHFKQKMKKTRFKTSVMGLVMLWALTILTYSNTKAQLYGEVGVPEVKYSLVSKAPLPLAEKLGFYSHLGYDFDRFGLNGKYYRANGFQDIKGVGLGYYYMLEPLKAVPQFSINAGLGFMYLRNRHRNPVQSYTDYDSYNLLLELKVNYKIVNRFRISTGFSFGYGHQEYLFLNNDNIGLSSLAPYRISFGVGYALKKRNTR